MSLSISGYSICEKISEGSKTAVYRGFSEGNKKSVIIKTLKSEYPSQKDLSRIKHEYETLNKLNISGITSAYGLEKHDNSLALVLEDFNGETLKEFIKNQICKMSEFLPIAIRLSEIVGEIHNEDIIHKDINPRNIIINSETKEVNIIDFSHATFLKKEEQMGVNPGSLEGTLAYMSPEQTGRMNRFIDYRTDFYSLGVTFYEMLTGTLPFQTNDVMAIVHCHIARIPIPPIEINKNVPLVVSEIVMKLLAKNAEDRYQSAYGLKNDLEECLRQLEEKGNIENFIIAQRDLSGHFNISQRLYGRDSEIVTLLKSFEKAGLGYSEMMLVSGYSGVGKSSLVHEVHKPIVRQRGYFISGKFDQYKRNVPYSALSQAFQELVQQLLTESEDSLEKWKHNLLPALNPNAQIIIDVIPEVEHIVGKQPPVPQLGPQETQNRFKMVFQQFLGVFTKKEHPLVIFLDDLQWVDSATLNLLKVLITDPDSKYFFVIGAYRDNEVDESHLLLTTLHEIQKTGVVVNDIKLSPLENDHINQLISDTLYCNKEKAEPLSKLIMNKTNGNPFFVNQFLKLLDEERLISFDTHSGSWQWDMEEIKNKSITDNVVELMADKIKSLQEDTQNILRIAACIGNQFDLNTLSIVNDKSSEETALFLLEGVKEGLVVPMDDNYFLGVGGWDLGVGGQGLGVRDKKGDQNEIISGTELYKEGGGDEDSFSKDSGNWKDAQRINKKSIQEIKSPCPTPDPWSPNPHFRFLHDRIQQAAYSLIPDDKRKELHLEVGRLMLRHATQEKIEEKIIDIVSHLNIGVELITDKREIIETVRLNLRAGEKAKASAAYNDALKFMTSGMGILPENGWTSQYELTLSLYTQSAEAAYLCGDYCRMETLIHEVLRKAKTLLDRLEAYEIRIQSNIAENKLEEAVDLAIDILGQLSIPIPKRITKFHIMLNMFRTKLSLYGKTVNDLENLPQMIDLHKLAAMRILMKISFAAYYTNPRLYLILTTKMVMLSVKYGNTPVSSYGYALYGFFLCEIEGNIDKGYQFGTLALNVMDRFNAIEFTAKIYFLFNYLINHKKKHLRETLEPLQSGYQKGLEVCDLIYASLCALLYCSHSFIMGEALESVERKMVKFSDAIRNYNQVVVLYALQIHRQLSLNLMGKSLNKYLLTGEAFDETEMLPVLIKANDRTTISVLYCLKSMLSYLFGDCESSNKNINIAKDYLEATIGTGMISVHNFYNSLSLLAIYPKAKKHKQKRYIKEILSNQKKMKKWAHHAPMNQLHRYYLVEAELARVREKDMRAIDLYDKAIALAKENEYVNEEALASEVAAIFYLLKGKDRIARAYMTDALYCYYRWGAHAKVKDLKEKYPQLLTQESDDRHSTKQISISTTVSSETSSKNLDLSTVMKASQTISGEIVLDNLLDKMMKIVIENAGAQRGVLIMEKKGELVIEAEGEITRNEVKMFQDIPIETNGMLPTSIIKYTVKTQDDVVLNDASHVGIFTEDYYVKKTQLKSVLCIPIANKGKLRGILYLENNLTKGAFTSERVELLKILSSQMAISLENSLFYSTLEQKVFERTEELKRSQEKLVEKEKMAALGHLVTGIAHEVNTPIGVGVTAASTIESRIKKFMKLYKSKEINHAEFEDFVKVINEGMQIISRNLQRAAEQIKSFKQVAVDQTNEIRRRFKVKEYIGDILLSLEPRLKNKKILIDIDCAEDFVLDSYPGAFSQIITNLVMNSVVHGFEKRDEGSINIQCLIDGKDLILCYKDDGRGIDKKVLPKIYDPFFTTNRQGGGSGLGLHIIYNLVTQKLNGTINCESKPGKGVLFSIKIPQKISKHLMTDSMQ